MTKALLTKVGEAEGAGPAPPDLDSDIARLNSILGGAHSHML